MDSFHRVEGHVVGFPCFEDPDDIGVVYLFCSFKLSRESMDPGGAHPREDFDSNLFARAGVAGQIDRSHPSLTKEIDDFVRTDPSNAWCE